MYEEYRKIKKINTEFRQGIENSQRLSEILGGYQKCTKGIGKLKKLSTEFQQGIKNSQRVSKMFLGYWKYYEGFGNVQRVSEN